MILLLLACNATGEWTLDVEPLAETVRETDDGCTIELASADTVIGNPAAGEELETRAAWAFDLAQDTAHTTGPVLTPAGDHADFTVWNMGYGAFSGGTVDDETTLLEQHLTARLVGEVTCGEDTASFDVWLHHDVEWVCPGAWELKRNGTASHTVAIDAWMIWADTIGGSTLVAADWIAADSDFNGVLTDDELEFEGLDLRDPGTTGALNVLEYTQIQPESWLSCP